MSTNLSEVRKNLFAIHILDDGVSIHDEQFNTMSDIDDVLIMGFITAIYNYTYSVGKEIISYIDLKNVKFLFSFLHDDKLLVMIANNTFTKKQETEIIDKIKLRYEILSHETNIEDMGSLLVEDEGIIPLELIGEIRRKGLPKQKFSQKPKKDLINAPSPQIQIPQVVSETFYFQIFFGEDKIDSNSIKKIKRTLTNFFLGYKNLFSCIFALNIQNELVIFVFGRGKFDDSIGLLETVLNQTLLKKDYSFGDGTPEEVKIDNDKVWVQSVSAEIKTSGSLFLSRSKNELITISPHTKRIMKFVSNLV